MVAEVLVGTGVDVAINPAVLDDVDASTLVLTAVADDDVLLLSTGVDGVGVVVLVIFEEGVVLVGAGVVVVGAGVVVAGAGVEVLEYTGVEVLAIPVLVDDANPVVMSPAVFVCEAVLVMTAVGDEDAMAIKAAGAGVLVVLAAPVLLLE